MLRNFFAREDRGQMEGQTLVEYGLIIALVSIMLVLALQAMTGALNAIFAAITAALTAAV